MSLGSIMGDSAMGIRPAINRDADLGQTQDFTQGNPGVVTLFTAYPCSYQEASVRTQMFYGQRDALVSNEVYFDRDPGIEPNDMLVVTRCRMGDTVKLIVVGQSDSIQAGTTWVYRVACERLRQPK